jgi:WD40 repeat protein/energy-coupling factor transporter ATP-binding protein EcfA2
VPLYDYWREPDGAYLVMRWLPGGNLDQSLQKAPWEPQRASRMLDQVSSALALAHTRGVVHRDLKPENILLDEGGNAYLSDFGLAKDLLQSTRLTEPGILKGSCAFISPEQVQGNPISPQSDLYSLGIVMYEVLTGQHPFNVETPVAMLFKHVSEPLPALGELCPDLPKKLDDVIRRATAKQPAERYPNTLEFAVAFRGALDRTHIAVPTPEVVLTTVKPENPYKGLRAFEEADAADFFGREALTQQLLSRLGEDGQGSRFLAVVGPSGSGKSSVVKAGILPALRRGAIPGSRDWFVVEMLPGSHPLNELEIGLLRVAASKPANLMEQLRRDEGGLQRVAQIVLPTEESELLLVVDQFEELFTRSTERSESEHLLHSIYHAVKDPLSRVRVIITLRADFYDRPLMHPEFSGLMRQRTEVVLPLKAEELSQAIRKPAERVGVALEPGLIPVIMADVSEQPGALPMLQYALTELFEGREDNTLTREAYQAIGGVSMALARRAEEVHIDLDEVSRATARQVFLRLVTLGEGAEDTRRRVLQSELTSIQMPGSAEDGDPLQQVIEKFGSSRLLRFDRDPATRTPTVEVAHEALLREWGRLRGWLDESRADLRMQRVLGNTAEDWLEADCDPSYLLRGARLTQYEAWIELTDLAMTEAERDYLDVSLEERRARQAAEAERQAREAALEKRSRRFLRAFMGVLAIASVIAVILAVFALNQREEALDSAATAAMAQGMAQVEAATAVAAQGEAQYQAELAAEAAEEAENQKSIAEQNAREVLEAYSLSLAANARQALQAKDPVIALPLALAAIEIEQQPPSLVLETLAEAAYSPGPRRSFDIGSTFGTEAQVALSVDYSPDGDTALIGLVDGTVILFNPETGAEIRRMEGHTSQVFDVAFSPDGKKAISGGLSPVVILWDLTTGQVIHRFRGHSGAIMAVDFSPDGLTAITGGFVENDLGKPGELILWDVKTGQEIRRCAGGHRDAVMDVVFNPDGYTALASSGANVDNLLSHSLPAEKIFPKDMEVDEFDLILWDVESCEITHQFETEDHDNYSLAISPVGDWALAGSTDHNIYLWDLKSGEQINRLEGHRNPVTTLEMSRDGRKALTGDAYIHKLILWDVGTWEPLNTFTAHRYDIRSVINIDIAISPDGRKALSCSSDGMLILWDLVDPRAIRVFEGHKDNITDVSFTPDGQYLLSSSGRFDQSMAMTDDNSIRMWDLKTGEQTRVFEGNNDGITTIDISPDGKQLISGSVDRSVHLWDIETGQEIGRLEGHGSRVTDVAFSPDGFSGLSGAADGSMIMWDLVKGTWLRAWAHPGTAISLVISPDSLIALSSGRPFQAGTDNSPVVIWELETGLKIDQFLGHREMDVHIGSMAISPDGRFVITGDSSGNLIQWDIISVQEIQRLNGHNAPITSVSISADGHKGFSCDEEGATILWDIDSGAPIGRFNAPDFGRVAGCALSPDGRFAAVSMGTTIILWQLDVLTQDELLTWIAANRYVRELTCEQRESYRIEPLCEE